MEDKKSYKIGLMPLLLLVLDIILIIVVIIMGLIIHNKNQIIAQNNAANNSDTVAYANQENVEVTNEVVENTNNTTNTVKEQNTNIINNNTVSNSTADENNSNAEEYVKKIVETRAYIYDAGYSADGITTNSYNTNDGVTHSVSDIVVPYINMVSDDATQMNSEIEKLYNGYIDEFKVCSQNLNSYIKSNYQTYVTSNIYSVLMTIERGSGDNTTTEYLAYNFDVISGTKLDYNQVCYIAGISSAIDSVQKTILNLQDYNNYHLSVNNRVSKDAVDAREEEILNCQNQVFTIYQEDLLNNKLVYFLDNNLKMNISVKVILPDNSEGYNKIVIVEN